MRCRAGTPPCPKHICSPQGASGACEEQGQRNTPAFTWAEGWVAVKAGGSAAAVEAEMAVAVGACRWAAAWVIGLGNAVSCWGGYPWDAPPC